MTLEKILRLALLAIVASAADRARAGAPEPPPADAPARVVLRQDGVRLEYERTPVAAGEDAELAGARAILAFRARITTDVPLGYRRVTLEPGRYALAVEKGDGEARHLVFREAPPAPRRARTRAREAEEADAGGEEEDSEQENDPEEDEEAADADPGAEKEADAPAPRPRRGQRPILLKVPLRTAATGSKAPGPEPGAALLEVELKALSRGKKLRITLRAGALQGTANLRVVPPPGGDDPTES